MTGFELLCQARSDDASGTWSETGLYFSRQGFFFCFPDSPFVEAISDDIRQRLVGELSKESLGWYEEEAKCLVFFSCYALGGIMGYYYLHLISESDFLLLDAQLPGFYDINANQIHQAYQS